MNSHLTTECFPCQSIVKVVGIIGCRRSPFCASEVIQMKNRIVIDISLTNRDVFGDIRFKRGRPTCGYTFTLRVVKHNLAQMLAGRCRGPKHTTIQLTGCSALWLNEAIPYMLGKIPATVVHVNERGQEYPLGEVIEVDELYADPQYAQV